MGKEDVRFAAGDFHATAFGGAIFSTMSRMSSARHAVICGPSARVGAGYLPLRTPAHQVDLQTGIIAGMPAFALPMICGNRRKPV